MSPDDKEAEAAIKMFHELTDQGCALRDIVAAIYNQGRSDALGKPPAPRPTTAPSIPLCPYDDIIAIYHDELCNPEKDARLPRVKTMDVQRKAATRQFWVWLFTAVKIGADDTKSVRATDKPQALKWTRRYFQRVFEDDHIMARKERGKGFESWVAGYEFVIRADTRKRIVETPRQPRMNGSNHEAAQP